MNWDAVGAIAELVGAGGVIASLLYLAAQTRQNTRETRVASFQQVASSFGEISLAIAQDAEIAELIDRARDDPDSLSPEERGRYGYFMLTLFRRAEAMYFHSEEGALQREAWIGIQGTLANTLHGAAGFEWFTANRYRFNPRFADYLAGLARSDDPAG